MLKKPQINTDYKPAPSTFNSSYVKSLLKSGANCDLNEIISKTELDMELFDLLWEKCDWEQRDELTSNAIFNENIVQWLSDSQIEEIISQNDNRILWWLSLHIYEFLYPGEYTKVNDSKERRCSKAILHNLIKHMVKSNDPEIRENIKDAAEQKQIYDHNPWMLNGLDC